MSWTEQSEDAGVWEAQVEASQELTLITGSGVSIVTESGEAIVAVVALDQSWGSQAEASQSWGDQSLASTAWAAQTENSSTWTEQ